MNKLAETVGYIKDMMVYHNGTAAELDGIARAKHEEMKDAQGKKRKELTMVVAQCQKEGTQAMMYAAFGECLCDLAYEIAEIKGIDLDKEIENGRLQRLQELKEEDEGESS